MNHVVLMLYLSNSFSSLRTPMVPAKRPGLQLSKKLLLSAIGFHRPLEMSLVESSPPYEPSQPATASISTDMQQRAPGGCQSLLRLA